MAHTMLRLASASATTFPATGVSTVTNQAALATETWMDPLACLLAPRAAAKDTATLLLLSARATQATAALAARLWTALALTAATADTAMPPPCLPRAQIASKDGWVLAVLILAHMVAKSPWTLTTASAILASTGKAAMWSALDMARMTIRAGCASATMLRATGAPTARKKAALVMDLACPTRLLLALAA